MYKNKIDNILCDFSLNYEIYNTLECGTHFKYYIHIFSMLTDDLKKNILSNIKGLGLVYCYFDEDDDIPYDFDVLIIEVTRENIYDADYFPISKKELFDRDFDDVPIGLDYFGEEKFYSISLFSFVQLLGDNDSGKYDFIKSIIYYNSVAYDDSELSIEIIDLNRRLSKLKDIPNVKAYITDPKLAIKILAIKLKEGLIREDNFSKASVRSFYEYNNKNDAKMSKRFVIIDGYNQLIKENPSFMIDEFIKFFSDGRPNGMYFILSDENIGPTEDYSFYKIIFKTSLEKSINFIGSEYGSVLGGHGDFVIKYIFGEKRYQAFRFDDDKYLK